MKRMAVTTLCLIASAAAGCGRAPRVSAPVAAAGPPPADSVVVPGPGAEVSQPGADARLPELPSIDPDAPAELGQASWYGDPYHGRRAASGEIFDKNKLTAAHRTLPFDTWVRVENRDNGRTVDVRINDRGQFVAGRIIDLSEAAARQIDMIRAGVASVRVSVLRSPDESVLPGARAVPTGSGVFYVVQLGAFGSVENARALARRLESRYTGIYVQPPREGTALWRVLIGRAVLRVAQRVQGQLSSEDGIEAIVVQVAD
jgi:rare lipoprotein A